MIRAIILKKQDRGEADELVVFLSRELGWLTGVAKNAKKSRVRFGGHLEPFSLVDLTLRRRKKDDLVWIDEAQVVRGFLGIRKDVSRVSRAAYFLELSWLFLGEGQPDPELHDYLVGFLDMLARDDPGPVPLLLSEIRLLGLLGYAPRFEACPICDKPLEPGQGALFVPSAGGGCHPGCAGTEIVEGVLLSPDTLAVVRRGLKVDSDLARRLKLGKKGQEELRKALSAFVRYLRGEEIKSLAFMERIAQ